MGRYIINMCVEREGETERIDMRRRCSDVSDVNGKMVCVMHIYILLLLREIK
jgi:hypothetical protein